ncbi:hypothetical protein [Cyanobium sp. Tous-M-B4]|uniref:hypothetical protein n=1 Tax=Cyanobium sp. Tous-M-B4 TaxID=2823724 RepID=UPI0020CBA689|nr:hypothetical protein [Cyanobium sp. Tous-M-B4]MCP9776493.1 hypothetical protein [Cyanobium sp. Tous-M-B4]
MLIGALIRWQLLQHLLHREIAYSSWLVTCIYGLMLAYALSLVLYLALLLWAYLPRLRRNAACSRRLLALLGALGSAEVIANLASLNLGIVRLGIASYALLLDGLLLYVSVNLSFFFWYWYFDYPLRLISADAHSAEQPRLPLGILFPEEAIEDVRFNSTDWIPGPIDYLYFTTLSSNCFAAPEGHLLIGSKLKTLQLIHSSSMILVFIVILARAINTLG